jgi:hypothetical protein
MSFRNFLARLRHVPSDIRGARIEGELDDLRACYDSAVARIAHLEAGRSADDAALGDSKLTIEVAPGELIDRLSILEIKLERIRDTAKLKNVRHEYEVTLAERRKLNDSPELERLAAELKDVNKRIWDIEDNIRDLERVGAFGDKFIAVARSVYQTNDRRAEIKRAINELLDSKLVEEKSYAPY